MPQEGSAAAAMDDFFGDNPSAGSEETHNDNPPSNDNPGGNDNPDNNNPDNSDESVINELIADAGITDSSKIKFDGDNGQVSERAWKDLTREEKKNILLSSGQSEQAPEINNVTDEEQELLDAIRNSNMSPSEYMEAVQNHAINAQPPTYEVDGLSDDELYMLDKLDELGEENVTDEQLEKLLNDAKSDPDLYKHAIESLRAQYKQREDDLKLQKQQEAAAQQEQDFDNFSSSILEQIQSLNNIAGQNIELSSDDMNDLANYILTRDENGESEFGKAMNDPETFTKVAFWALNGDKILSEISGQLKLAYEKGLAAGKKGQSQLEINANHKDNKPNGGNQQFSSAASLDVQ